MKINTIPRPEAGLYRCLNILMAAALMLCTSTSLNAQELPSPNRAPDSAANKAAQALIGSLPRTFEQNMGQLQGGQRFLSTGNGYMLSLSPTGATFSLRDSHRHVVDVRMLLKGANPNAMLTGLDPVAAKKNYLYGRDSSKWLTNVPSFQKVKVKDALPGVNVLYYGSQQQLEYDFDIAAGTDPRTVTLKFDGAKSLQLDKDGDLVVETAAGPLHLQKPDAYQQDASNRRAPVQTAYILGKDSSVAFQVVAYDHSKPLVIDPVIQYATYWAGTLPANGTVTSYESGSTELIFGFATDKSGASYVYGLDLWSVLTPLGTQTLGSCPSSGCVNVFVMKFDPSKSGAASLVYTTLIPAMATEDLTYTTAPLINQSGAPFDYLYAGPTTNSQLEQQYFDEQPEQALALDSAGHIFFTGGTDNPNYPVTTNSYATKCNLDPGDPQGQFCVPAMYISELSNDGTQFLYSTFINAGKPVATTSGAAGQTTIIYPAFGQSLAVDNADVVYVGGRTYNGFPLTNGYQCDDLGPGGLDYCADAVAVKLDTTKTGTNALTYAELFFSDQPFVATDGAGDLYWSHNFCPSASAISAEGTTPVPLNGYSTTIASGTSYCSTLMRLNPTGAITYATLLLNLQNGGLAADVDGRAYVAGYLLDQSNPIKSPIVNGFVTPYVDGRYAAIFAYDTTKTGTASLVYSSAVDTTGGFQSMGTNGCGSVVATGFGTDSALSGSYLVNQLPGAAVGYSTFSNSFAMIFNTKMTGLNSLTFSSYLPGTNGLQVLNSTLNLQGTVSLEGYTSYSTGNFVFTPTANAYQSVPFYSGIKFNPFFETINQAIPSGCLNFSPTSLAFGNEPVGSTTATQAVTLTNTSETSLTISSIVASAGFTETNTCGTSLAQNASCTINTAFSPTTAGAQTGTLTFTNSDVGSPQVIPLTGTGTQVSAPGATLSPSSIAFGNQTVSTTSTAQVVTLTNSGTAALTISGVSITGTNPTDFAYTSACGTSLAVNASCNISVTFTPASATSFSATLSVADNATGSPQTVVLTGTGTPAAAPGASLSPTSISFPNTLVNSTATAMSTTLTNNGTASLTITGITLTGTNTADFAISANTCGNTLAASATCTISATFTPLSAASFTAAISVADNATGSPQTVTLSGTGIAPVASLSPTTLAFPNTPVSSTATAMSTVLTNSGSAPLTISNITLTGTNPTDFTISANTCGMTLAVTATCTISVTFTPASAASFSAAISVTDNATGSPQTVTLTGTGTAPGASFSPTMLAFPNTTVSTTASAMSTTLTNTGNAALTISSITLTGTNPTDFAISANTCGMTLAASATCSISVTFTPASVASFAAAISVADNATGSPQTVTLTGTGVSAATPLAVLSPTSLSFGNQNVSSTSAAQTVSLSNPGTAALTISNIALGGTNPADFAISANTCGVTLAASATCFLSITFTPAAVASYAATLSFADNAAGSPQTVSLSGSGIAPGDFTLSSTTPSLTIDQGRAAQYSMVVAATGGTFSNLVTLSATGLPNGATVSFAPVAVTPGSGSATSIMTIQTPRLYGKETPMRLPWLPPAITIALCIPVFWRRRRKMQTLLSSLLLCALLSAAAALAGCGGGFGRPPATYALTVTGTSGTDFHSTTVNLTVQ